MASIRHGRPPGRRTNLGNDFRFEHQYLWLPLTGLLLLVPAVRNNKEACIVIACLQAAGAVININRGLDTQAFLELIIRGGRGVGHFELHCRF